MTSNNLGAVYVLAFRTTRAYLETPRGTWTKSRILALAKKAGSIVLALVVLLVTIILMGGSVVQSRQWVDLGTFLVAALASGAFFWHLRSDSPPNHRWRGP
jgi:hypothetical protein